MIMGGDSLISKEDIERCIDSGPKEHSPASTESSASTLEEMERARIRRALADCNGNVTRAAASLGITRASLYRRIEKYKIEL